MCVRMARVYYNKLVRDKIKFIIEDKAQTCEVRVIETDREFQQELLKKVVEEAQALSMCRTREDFIGELADLMLVLDALNDMLHFSEKDIEQAIEESVRKKGTYSQRHFLHWSDDKTYESTESPLGLWDN